MICFLFIPFLLQGQSVYDLLDSLKVTTYLQSNVSYVSESIQLFSNGKEEKAQKKWEFELDSNRFVYREFKNNQISREDFCLISPDYQIFKDSIFSGNKKLFEFVERDWKGNKLLSETHYLPNGKIRSQIRQGFDEHGNINSYLKWNQKDTIAFTYRYVYKKGKVLTKSTFSHDGDLIDTRIYEYDKHERSVKVYKLDALAGKIPLQYKVYDSLGLLVSFTRFQSGKPIYQHEYSYNQFGKKTREKVKNTQENYSFIHSYFYDKNQQLTEVNGKYELESEYDYQVIYKYKKGLLVSEKHLDKGHVKKEINHQYNKRGNKIKTVVYQGKKAVYQYQYLIKYKK